MESVFYQNKLTQEQRLQLLSLLKQSLLSKTQMPAQSKQRAYDYVYKLCRDEKQLQVKLTVQKTIQQVLPEIFSTLNTQSNNFLLDFSQFLEQVEKGLTQLKCNCLYLNNNYFIKIQKKPMIDFLNEVFLTELFKQQNILQALGKRIALEHLDAKQQNIKKVLNQINTIDIKQLYFTHHFVKYYTNVLIEHYKKAAEQKFHQNNTSQKIINFIQWAQDSLKNESQFLKPFGKLDNNKTFIINRLYQVIVKQYKAKIYEQHKDNLFKNLTLNVLELFNYDKKTDDIEKHANWYNMMIKQRLQKLNNHNNNQFLSQICEFYNKIMNILEKAYKKFDIHYRSRFAFEEWINNQKLQMPSRLNEYIKDFTLGKLSDSTDKVIMDRIDTLFILMKEKNLFQKYYRRELISRILANQPNYSPEREAKVVQLMEKQCSQEFVKNLKPLLNNQSLNQQKNSEFNVFLAESQSWPYDQKNPSVSINKQLISLTQKFTSSFQEPGKDRNLFWHPIIGVVKIHIKFMKSLWEGELILNTCMANLLLCFNTHKQYELKNFCCQTGYKLDQIYESVQKLLLSKVLINQGTEDAYKLALNQDFSTQGKTFNVINVEISTKFDIKNLQELKADRKLMVQAIIVKLMKKLKNTKKQAILAAAAPMIEKRGFNFNAKFVQSAIDRLIQKQFIRDFQDGQLGYIA